MSHLRIGLVTVLAAGALAQSESQATRADVERWFQEVSNRGRWGAGDRIGTLNLITPAKRKASAKLVRDGVVVSLAREVEKEKAVDVPMPFQHSMLPMGPNATFHVDSYAVSYHGYAHTHLDSLNHMFHEGKFYNGLDAREPEALGVISFASGIFTRGILMDIPALKNVRYLDPGYAIMPADLEAWEKKAGIRVRAGDAVFIRTGRWARRAEKGPWNVSEQSAGLHGSCARWLRQRDAALIGSDAASDVMPSGISGVRQPIHMLALVAMGMPIFDNCDLEAVSKKAAELRRWEFLLTAAPLAVRGGTGSPLNPIAIF